MALDFFAYSTLGLFPTPTPSTTERAAWAATLGMFGGPLPISIVGTDLLNGESRWANVERNINKYFVDNVFTTEGIDTDILGLKFSEKDSIEWVRPRVVSMDAEYLRQASDTHYGEDVNIMFTVDCFVKKSGTTISDRHYVLRDTVANYFKIGQDVDIEDYVSGTTSTNRMRVRRILEDSPMMETQTYYQYKIGWLLDYTRKTTKP